MLGSPSKSQQSWNDVKMLMFRTIERSIGIITFPSVLLKNSHTCERSKSLQTAVWATLFTPCNAKVEYLVNILCQPLHFCSFLTKESKRQIGEIDFCKIFDSSNIHLIF